MAEEKNRYQRIKAGEETPNEFIAYLVQRHDETLALWQQHVQLVQRMKAELTRTEQRIYELQGQANGYLDDINTWEPSPAKKMKEVALPVEELAMPADEELP